MAIKYCGISIPLELSSYEKFRDYVEPKQDVEVKLLSGVEVNRDFRGRILSVNHYAPNKELMKQVFYQGMNVSNINYYSHDRLCAKEEYQDEKLISKTVYNKNGVAAYTIKYDYVREKLTCISKITGKNEIVIKYLYDELDRIITRKIFVDLQLISQQEYSYDVLDRITEYRDENQEIFVKNISTKNELLSYSITDKIGNEILIENHFTEYGYQNTVVTLNGHSITVSDTSYVDNIMLKKPYASDEDLDLIISSLMKQSIQSKRTDYQDILNRKTMGLIDTNIQVKSLPISIRKRVLFNIAVR